MIVEGVNRVKKHTKVGQPAAAARKTGGIVTTEAPIHVTNVMLVDGKAQSTRVGYARRGHEAPLRRLDDNGTAASASPRKPERRSDD